METIKTLFPSQMVLWMKAFDICSSLSHNAYSYSKTVAEKEAWSICENQSKWDLVVLNPSLVFGPGLISNATSESFSIMKSFGNGLIRRR